ncbi:MAG: ABC transporter ATP-binding protein [Alphaproteobacteria bacterium]|nr:ABC transporter ATP-binding protein [Alphaproteobacteria bacterium]
MNKRVGNIEIRVNNVSKSFRDVSALNNVSLDFHTGNLYGVIGPAGAGKTTLFRIMLDLMRADVGGCEYFCDGHSVSFDEFRQNIAYMPQSQSLYSDLSVGEHLDFFRRLYSLDNAEFRKKRTELLKLTRLDKFLDRTAGNLSGGMYKKLGLMCALLRSPRVMLLDEPTNGVDPISRREFWNLLHDALNSGILVIMTTAYMDEAERCDRVVLMDSGHVLGAGEPRELLNKYKCANFDEFFLVRGGNNK